MKKHYLAATTLRTTIKIIRQHFEIDTNILVQRCLFLDLTVIKSSFPVTDNVSTIGISVFLKFENK